METKGKEFMRVGDVDNLLMWDGVRASASVGILPLLVDKTMEVLRQGNTLPNLKGMGIQSYCADLAVSYADALVERLKGGK